MATYNKRGYKQPKPEEEKTENQVDQFEEVVVEEGSTTEVFETLDEKASIFQDFFVKNQKIIFGVVGAVAGLALIYGLYSKFVVEPKETEAAGEMFQAQQYFDQAGNGFAADSLYNLALNGGEGKYGLLRIIEDYSGTKAANLAQFYAGLSYLNTGKFKEAISHLEKYKAEDKITKPLALGAIGDAFVENGQKEQALDYYTKAINADKNEFTTPRFLFKAANLSIELGKKADALKYFTQIKEQYPMANEAANIDGYIGLAQ
nr:tetratricopeptide repeat protein [uncultured Flavobacterium sp.]